MARQKTHYAWIYPVITIVLVGVISLFLAGQWSTNQLRADGASSYIITAELGDDQPESVTQQSNQWIAQFKLSTDSPDPVEVKGVELYAMGDLKNKIVRQLGIVPLHIMWQKSTIGTGEIWVYDYGRIYQRVVLDTPITLSKTKPAVFDIYADLTLKSGRTFGVSLIGLDSPLVADGIPVDGYVRKIKVF